MFISIAFIYNLNKKKVAQMTQELQQRRGAVSQGETLEQVIIRTGVDSLGEEIVDIMDGDGVGGRGIRNDEDINE